MQKTALKVASAIFFIIAILHLARVVFGIPVTVGSYEIPQSASIVAFVVALLLSWWMLKVSK